MVNVHIHQFAPGGAVVDATAMEQFQKQWGAYQKLVDSDVLSHRAAGATLHQVLAGIGQPFTFLDIACGDASLTRRALAGTQVSHYHGIDLSEPAIELAEKMLDGAPYEVDLDHQDFVTALEERPEPADVVWCGLSIHHLGAQEPTWTTLTPEEHSQIVHHIETSDLPETAADWLDLGRQAGFAKATQLFVDPTDGLRIFRYDV
jgi:2-polyprenyl-3-methyl-5-hydroxy-6-metoxy-1,4-benzoquinol methylase